MNIENMSKKELLKLKKEIDDKLKDLYTLNEKFKNLNEICSYYSNCGEIMIEYIQYTEPERYSTVYYSELLEDFPESLFEFMENLLINENTVKIFSDKFNKVYTVYNISDIVKQIKSTTEEDKLYMELWTNMIKQEAVDYGYKGCVVDW